MTKIIGIRFREVGKIYYFSPSDLDIKVGDKVIVETSRGLEYGNVVLGNREVSEESITSPLKSVIRIATLEDRKQLELNRAKEIEAFKICKEKILQHKLEMKAISAEYTFDASKLLFYFTAEGRIDFRDLVKDLVSIFKVRIELRQVGVRDETKIVGGIGSCGRPLCCHTYLSNFVPVSIKMAKDQNLSLNPQKVSGTCGRLMCCLKNEAETYEYLNSKLPNENEYVYTNTGIKALVSSRNVLKQTVKLIVSKENDEKEILELHVSEIKFKARNKSYNNDNDEFNEFNEFDENIDENIDYELLEDNLELNDNKKLKNNFKKKYNKNRPKKSILNGVFVDNLLKENERLDDLEINNLRIIQNPKKFCFGIDAVLLSDFAKIKTNTKLVDFCTGNAIIPLLISAKYKPANISAIEYQDSIFDMAKRSIIYNKLENFIELINGDIRQIKQYYKAQSFDYVTCNPPYMENNKAIQNTNDSMKIARHEITCTIEDVIYASSYVLKNNGTLYMVHRPNRLVNLMKVLNKYKLEVKKLRFVHSKIDKKANLVLIEAVKGAGSWLDIEAPLIVYNLDNTYTQEILKIYGKL